MLDRRERWIQFHEINLKSEPEHAPPLDLNEIMPHLLKRIDEGNAHKLINKGTAALRFTKAKTYPQDKIVVLLAQYADKNVTAPVFSDLETGTLREEPLLEGEGVAVSAHIAISLEPRLPNSPFYSLLLEEIPGLGRSMIGPFLRSELKMVSRGLFEFRDETANNAKKKYRPATEVNAIPAVHLKEDIDSDQGLREIELIRYEEAPKRFDEYGYFNEKSHTLKLSVELAHSGMLDKMLSVLRKKARSEGYSDVRIRYKNAGGKQKTALIGTAKADLADALVSKTEKVTADEVLAQCQADISPSIANKMIELMLESRS